FIRHQNGVAYPELLSRYRVWLSELLINWLDLDDRNHNRRATNESIIGDRQYAIRNNAHDGGVSMSEEDKIVEKWDKSGEPDAPIPLFSSVRERRLWAWTLAVVVAIYSTLGLATTLVEVLRNRELFDGTFLVGYLLIWAAILTQGLKTRPRGAEIGVALGIAAVYLMLFARMGIPERTHLFEYSVVALFMYEALTERARQERRVPIPALLAIVATALIGTLDECIQAFLPNRVFDPLDILFNVLAAVMAVTASVALGWARRQVSRSRRSQSG
ncbi:MAG: VanZ family protein, partial [Ardenticatenaceae bacterium]